MGIEFGQSLQRRAKELGLADAEVARRVEVSQSRYANYVAGTRQPDFSTLIKICRALDTSPDELLKFRPRTGQSPAEDVLIQRINAAAQALDTSGLETAAIVLDALAKSRDIVR